MCFEVGPERGVPADDLDRNTLQPNIKLPSTSASYNYGWVKVQVLPIPHLHDVQAHFAPPCRTSTAAAYFPSHILVDLVSATIVDTTLWI